MSAQTILVQIVITVVVVALYHLLFSSKKETAQQSPSVLPAPPKQETAPAVPVTVSAPVIAAVVAPPPAVPAPAPLAPAPVVAAMVVAPPKPAPVQEDTPPEILAVIAAAIAVVIGKTHRVVAVQQAVAAPNLNVWALEGRVEHFMSHRVR